MKKNVAGQSWLVYAMDEDGLPKTGDGANILGKISIDGGALAALATPNPTEVSAAYAKGWYRFSLSQAETNGATLALFASSSTAGVTLFADPSKYETEFDANLTEAAQQQINGADMYLGHTGDNETSGAAVLAAIAVIAPGQKIKLGAGKFNLGENGLFPSAPDIVLDGSGPATIIQSSVIDDVTGGAIWSPTSGSTIRNLTIEAIGSGFQTCIGGYFGGYGFTLAYAENIRMIGETDGILLSPYANGRLICKNVVSETKWDNVMVYSGVVELDGGSCSSSGPSVNGSGSATALRTAGGGRIVARNMRLHAGGTNEYDAAVACEGGSIEIGRCQLTNAGVGGGYDIRAASHGGGDGGAVTVFDCQYDKSAILVGPDGAIVQKDASGNVTLDPDQRVKLAAAQPDYAPAKPSDLPAAPDNAGIDAAAAAAAAAATSAASVDAKLSTARLTKIDGVRQETTAAADKTEMLAAIAAAAPAGDGDMPVNHDTGGNDNLRLVDPSGNGIDNAAIRAYLTADYESDPTAAVCRAMSVTGADGRWVSPMMLNTGLTYTIVFSRPGYNAITKEVTP